MSLYKLVICISLISVSSAKAANFGCQKQLKEQIWPLDCFLYLEIKRTHKKSHHYEDLNTWCKLYEDELFHQATPEALFSLYTPPNCEKVAQRSKKASQSLKILKGDFLNSFL